MSRVNSTVTEFIKVEKGPYIDCKSKLNAEHCTVCTFIGMWVHIGIELYTLKLQRGAGPARPRHASSVSVSLRTDEALVGQSSPILLADLSWHGRSITLL